MASILISLLLSLLPLVPQISIIGSLDCCFAIWSDFRNRKNLETIISGEIIPSRLFEVYMYHVTYLTIHMTLTPCLPLRQVTQ